LKILNANHPDAQGKALAAQFPATKELLITEEIPEIYIEPGSTFQEMKALEKSLEMEKVQAYMPFLGLSYPDENSKDAQGNARHEASHWKRRCGIYHQAHGRSL